MNYPPFKGGQGRSPESVIEAGSFLMGVAFIAAVVCVVLALVR